MRVAACLSVVWLLSAVGLPAGDGSAPRHAQEAVRFDSSRSGKSVAGAVMPALCQSQPPAGKKAKGNDKDSGKTPSTKESAEMRARARKAIKDGDLGAAEALLRDGARVKGRAEREAWMLIEAEYRLAKKQPAAAGLAAMRLVILRPDSERVGEALYWAGRSYEGLKRPYKAIELYGQCLAHQKTDDATRKLAKARLTKLENQAGEE